MTIYSVKRIYAAVSMAEEAALAMHKIGNREEEDEEKEKERRRKREEKREIISKNMCYVHDALRNKSIKRMHDQCRMNMNSLAWAKGYASDSIRSPYLQNLIMLDGMLLAANRLTEIRFFDDSGIPGLLTEIKKSIETIFEHEKEYQKILS